MQQINKVEILGVVGAVSVRPCTPNINAATFSVATNHTYKNHSGDIIVETVWHRVIAWDNVVKADLNTIKKGTWVHVKGRLRNVRYTDASGQERTTFEVYANELEIVDPKSERE